MKRLLIFVSIFTAYHAISAQKPLFGVGISYNVSQFKHTDKRIYLFDLGYNIPSSKPSMGVTLNMEKRLSPIFVCQPYVNILFKSPYLSKVEYVQSQGGLAKEFVYFRFFSVDLGSKVLLSKESWKLKISPIVGFNFSMNHYTGMTSGKTVKNGPLLNIYEADFEEYYPTTFNLGVLTGVSYRFNLLKRAADVYAMTNFALTNPFSKSIGTDKNRNSMYLDGNLTVYSVGLNIYFKK